MPIICILGIAFGLSNYIFWLTNPNHINPPLIGPIALIALLSYTILWLFFGEFRSKMVKGSIEANTISVKKFGGLASSKSYIFSEIDGFKVSLIRSKGDDNEYFYLIKNGNKILKLSDFYHKNYFELKEKIKLNTSDLGVEQFTLLNEIKESFS